jgi:hypothetical protein
VTEIDASHSEGPILARSIQQGMLQDEEFCLQVDSHSIFKPHWDDRILKMWMSVNNEYAVLTSYVHDLAQYYDSYIYAPIVCKTVWGQFGLPRNSASEFAEFLPRPKLNNLWCAGLSFSKCHAERIPINPEFAGIFDGEEFSRSSQLWTHGYDFYLPHEHLIYHDYFHKLWKEKRNWLSNKVQEKPGQVSHLLNVDETELNSMSDMSFSCSSLL